jgi:hypothetical protein
MLPRKPPCKAILVLCAALVLLAGLTTSKSEQASNGVDMILVIAVDVSASVDGDEFQLMREGLARAISSPQVANAIISGANGAIAIAVMQWSGFTEHEVKVDWTRVASLSDLQKLSGRIRRMKRRYDGATDIGGALDYCIKMLASAPFQTSRRVIDLAGDGTNNVNYPPNLERDRAVGLGMIINALAVTGDHRELVEYYERFVIGGEGAFVESTNTYSDFENAMRRKLVREIGSMMLF